MRVKVTRTELFPHDELSEKAQRAAIEGLYAVNVDDHDWWDGTYEDAKSIGCDIGGFDINRGGDISFMCDDHEATAHAITKDHGDSCDTHKLAAEFLGERDSIIGSADKDEDGEFVDEYQLDARLDEAGEEFARALGEEYLSILRRDYEYLTGEEAILETIKANEYEFTVDGKLA